jgi:hypothetical protein
MTGMRVPAETMSRYSAAMRRILTVIIIAAGCASVALAQDTVREWPSQQGAATLDQGDDPAMGRGGRCRFEGDRIEQGESQCITDAQGRSYSAVCAMSLNNTSWIPQEGSCAD